MQNGIIIFRGNWSEEKRRRAELKALWKYTAEGKSKAESGIDGLKNKKS